VTRLSGTRTRDLSPPKRLYQVLGPPSLLSKGYLVSFPWVRRPGREVNHSHPSRARVTNKWRHTSTLTVCIHGVERGKFTLLFTFLNNTKERWVGLIPSNATKQTGVYTRFLILTLLLSDLCLLFTSTQQKGKAIPLQAWSGPEGTRRLRLPDFKTFGT